MTRALALIVPCLAFGGCYTLDQARFDADTLRWAQVGMSLAEASARLAAEGFTCDTARFTPEISCSRQRSSLWPPYTCIERVNLASTGGIVEQVQTPPIACAGL